MDTGIRRLSLEATSVTAFPKVRSLGRAWWYVLCLSFPQMYKDSMGIWWFLGPWGVQHEQTACFRLKRDSRIFLVLHQQDTESGSCRVHGCCAVLDDNVVAHCMSSGEQWEEWMSQGVKGRSRLDGAVLYHRTTWIGRWLRTNWPTYLRFLLVAW